MKQNITGRIKPADHTPQALKIKEACQTPLI